MKRLLQNTLLSLGLILGLSLALSPASSYAACSGVQCLKEGAGGTQDDPAKNSDLMGLIKNITNMILLILGAVAVVVIVIGGVRYVTSNGESNNLKAAKDTILYAVIGLVVAIVAYAIVNFVLVQLIKP